LEIPVQPATTVLQELLDLPDLLDCLECRDNLELLVSQDLKGHKDLRVLMEKMDRWGIAEVQARQGLPVPRVLWGHRVRAVLLDPSVSQALRERLVQRALREIPEPQDRSVRQVLTAVLAHRELPALQDRREVLELQAFRDNQDHRVRKDHPELLATPVTPEVPEIRDNKEQQEQQEPLEIPVTPEYLELPVSMVPKDPKVSRAQAEPRVLSDYRVQLELLDPLELADRLG